MIDAKDSNAVWQVRIPRQLFSVDIFDSPQTFVIYIALILLRVLTLAEFLFVLSKKLILLSAVMRTYARHCYWIGKRPYYFCCSRPCCLDCPSPSNNTPRISGGLCRCWEQQWGTECLEPIQEPLEIYMCVNKERVKDSFKVNNFVLSVKVSLRLTSFFFKLRSTIVSKLPALLNLNQSCPFKREVRSMRCNQANIINN